MLPVTFSIYKKIQAIITIRKLLNCIHLKAYFVDNLATTDHLVIKKCNIRKPFITLFKNIKIRNAK